MKDFKDLYVFPLHKEKIGSWVYDAAGNFVFQFEGVRPEEREALITIINGGKKAPSFNPNLKFYHKDGEIIEQSKGIPIITIRGWGNLTGTGAHNLPAKVAANIQDTFAEYIVERLNHNQ